MSGHTPGPWRFDGPFVRVKRMGRAGKIAEVSLAYKDSETYWANGNLIAAAPTTAAERDRLKEINADLLEALKRARRVLSMVEVSGPSEFLTQIDDAISRAETPDTGAQG